MKNWTNDEKVEALAWAETLRSLSAEVYVDDGGAALVDEHSSANSYILSVECAAFKLCTMIIANDCFEAYLGWTPTGSSSVAYSAFGRGDFGQAGTYLTWLKLRGPMMAEDIREATNVEREVQCAKWDSVAHLASFNFVRFESPPWDHDTAISIDDLPARLRRGTGSPYDFGTEIYDFVRWRSAHQDQGGCRAMI